MRVLLGMSGGLDSTYAVCKLREMGFEVEGAVLKMHEYTETEAAQKSADALGVPLHIIDARSEFDEAVVKPFIEEYKKGRTPNPCVICNGAVKFRILFDYALRNGFDKIATGHYASVVSLTDTEGITRHAIKKAKDEKKDQSYMLWRLSEDILSHLVLPLDKETKDEIRASALEMKLSAADRKDSQEICFIPDGDYAGYIERRVGASPEGNFIDTEGKILGKHKGIIHYTIGQRKGLGIALGARAFVTEIDAEANTVTLDTNGSEGSKIKVINPVFSGMKMPKQDTEEVLFVKCRYLAKPVKAKVKFISCGDIEAEFETPQRALTPGQSCVFYKDETVMLGGIIDKVMTK